MALTVAPSKDTSSPAQAPSQAPTEALLSQSTLSSTPTQRDDVRRAIAEVAQTNSAKTSLPVGSAESEVVRVTTYVVKKGDTASEIAQSVASERHPLHKQLALMRELNASDLESLQIGQRIKVPTKDQPSLVLYRVSPGDTLEALSKRFQITVGLLQVINKMGDGEILRAGDYINILSNKPRRLVRSAPLTPTPTQTSAAKSTPPANIETFVAGLKDDFGSLCRLFESQGRTSAHSNAEADPGGASWGCYQIAESTMPMFIEYLKEGRIAPSLSAEQRKVASKAYDALKDNAPDSASFKRDWGYLAKTDPRDFRALQHNFILDTHLVPVLQEAKKLGFDITPQTAEVFLSIGVQHGRFAAILKDAAGSIDLATSTTEEQVTALYESRRGYVKELKQGKLDDIAESKGLSQGSKRDLKAKVERLWDSVLNRYDREERLALSLLDQDKG